MKLNLLRIIESHAKSILNVILLITILCVIPLSRLKLDTNIDKLFPANDPDVLFYQQFRDIFNSDIDNETILIGLENSNGIFQADFLFKIDSLTKYITKLNHIQKVYSLTNSSFIYLKDNQFNAKPVIRISQPQFYKEDSIHLFESPEYRDLLISKSGKSVAIAVLNDLQLDDLGKTNLFHSIKLKTKELGFDRMHFLAKIDIETKIKSDLQRSLIIYLLLFLIYIALILYLLYRSVSIALITLSILGISITWILSIGQIFGFHLNLFSVILPITLTLVTTTNVYYFINGFKANLKNGISKINALDIGLKNYKYTGFLRSLLFAVIFFAFSYSNNHYFKLLGIFTGIGILLSFLLCMLILTSYYIVYSEPKFQNSKISNKKWTVLSNFFYVNSLKYKYFILFSWTILVIVFAFYTSKLEFNSRLLDKLPKSLMEDYQYIENDFYGSRSFEMALIIKDHQNSFINKSMLQKVEEIEKYLKDSCSVGHIISPISLFKGANKAYHGGSNLFFELPESQNEINTYTQNIMQTEYSDEMKRFLTKDAAQLRISGRMNDIGIKEFKRVEKRFENFYKRNSYSQNFSYKITGPIFLMDKLTSFLFKNLLIILIAGFIAVLIFAIYLLNSMALTFIVFLSNILPLLFMNGVLNICGINFNVLPEIYSILLLGITSTNIILYLHQLKLQAFIKELKELPNSGGQNMILISMVIICILLSLITSYFNGIFQIGFIFSISLLITLIFNLSILPILLFFWKRKS